MAIFWIFKTVAIRHLGFSLRLLGTMCAFSIVQNLVEIGDVALKFCRFHYYEILA